jgi:hypothetical protein
MGCIALGSCFAETIGEQLHGLKFPICINPFGILYQPDVLGRALRRLADPKPYEAEELFFHQDVWRHFDFHSRYAHTNREQALELMNAQLEAGARALREADLLLLTLGTAWGYALAGEAAPAANCHKLPGSYFVRRRLTVEACIGALEDGLAWARAVNPGLKTLLTVSPVRYLREGAVENQRSKATLLMAAEALCDRVGETYYFPAYELLMDELRDYRWYADDLCHPSAAAARYIGQRFETALCDETTQALNGRLRALAEAAAHRPFFPATAGHQAFVRRQLDGIAALERAFPFLNLVQERAVFQSQLLPKPSGDEAV